MKESRQAACSKSSIGCTECKKELAEKIIGLLAPIQEKRNALLKDKKHIRDILSAGRERAAAVASKTIAEVKELLKI